MKFAKELYDGFYWGSIITGITTVLLYLFLPEEHKPLAFFGNLISMIVFFFGALTIEILTEDKNDKSKKRST